MRRAIKNGAGNVNLNVVINNTKGICPAGPIGNFNCVASSEHILPAGSALRVWMKDPVTGRMQSKLIEGKGSLEG
ncbi:DddA-like double-stranded DNA deaminase toxin [Kitasatospora sp. NPDC008115]|uniref:DddA-like double-stranded DNA deaminase toxin n=1 Tax=Kitasatospora sp. NPDC008115 TaxID=3364022 RepID=UPI0036EE90F0